MQRSAAPWTKLASSIYAQASDVLGLKFDATGCNTMDWCMFFFTPIRDLGTIEFLNKIGINASND